jgi:hypothetical protein
MAIEITSTETLLKVPVGGDISMAWSWTGGTIPYTVGLYNNGVLFGSQYLTGDTSTSLTIGDATLDDAGDYKLIVSGVESAMV